MNIPVLGIFVTTLLDGRIFKENKKKILEAYKYFKPSFIRNDLFCDLLLIYWIASIYFFEQVLSTHMLILLFILYKWTSSQREIPVFVATKILEFFSKNSRTQLSWSAVLWTIFYFIMHVIKINNFFTPQDQWHEKNVNYVSVVSLFKKDFFHESLLLS